MTQPIPTPTARHLRVASSLLVQDRAGRILVVREADPRVAGRINLPGGHVEPGETLVACAQRECAEETGQELVPVHLLGIYQQSGGLNFVYQAESPTSVTRPGPDI